MERKGQLYGFLDHCQLGDFFIGLKPAQNLGILVVGLPEDQNHSVSGFGAEDIKQGDLLWVENQSCFFFGLPGGGLLPGLLEVDKAAGQCELSLLGLDRSPHA